MNLPVKSSFAQLRGSAAATCMERESSQGLGMTVLRQASGKVNIKAFLPSSSGVLFPEPELSGLVSLSTLRPKSQHTGSSGVRLFPSLLTKTPGKLTDLSRSQRTLPGHHPACHALQAPSTSTPQAPTGLQRNWAPSGLHVFAW